MKICCAYQHNHTKSLINTSMMKNCSLRFSLTSFMQFENYKTADRTYKGTAMLLQNELLQEKSFLLFNQ